MQEKCSPRLGWLNPPPYFADLFFRASENDFLTNQGTQTWRALEFLMEFDQKDEERFRWDNRERFRIPGRLLERSKSLSERPSHSRWTRLNRMLPELIEP